jgi:hypothetical protein
MPFKETALVADMKELNTEETADFSFFSGLKQIESGEEDSSVEQFINGDVAIGKLISSPKCVESPPHTTSHPLRDVMNNPLTVAHMAEVPPAVTPPTRTPPCFTHKDTDVSIGS